MKRSKATARIQPETVSDADETMAMVYVGDVYSLVAQEGSVSDAPSTQATSTPVENGDTDVDSSADDDLRPFLR